MPLQLRNPHSVLAALETRPQDVLEIRAGAGKPTGAWSDVVERAAQHRIPVLHGISRQDQGRRRPKHDLEGKTGRVGAAQASVKERGDLSLDAVFREVQAEGVHAGLWLALDCIQDPHNVGAIMRSAAFFGVRGVILTRERSAPLNATVYDVASGGLEYVPFSVQTNLSRALEQAKQAGLWVLGTSEHADTDVAQIDRDRCWLLVLGNEERGLRRLTLEKCDQTCRLTPRGPITSLNVSVAAGALMAALTAR
jgi:23S rRNA (guanosine2251-2'-O)-methyltransferase